MERPKWHRYYLRLAEVLAARSTCIRRKYGAVIVKDNRVISTGYNGSARGEVNCCDTGKCVRKELNVPAGERYELCVAVHAEMNAIINGNPDDMDGATIYIAGFNEDGTRADGQPCMMCDRAIKNARIKQIAHLTTANDILINHTYQDSACRNERKAEGVG
jgi:dCMP deaminase